MYETSNDEFPLKLKLCPAETPPIVATEALKQLTLLNDFKMGPDLARAIDCALKPFNAATIASQVSPTQINRY
jgi:hypothetical protein